MIKEVIRYLLIFLLIITCGYGILYYHSYKDFATPENNPGFVTIKDNSFFCNNKKFFPLILNYIVALHFDGNNVWISPSLNYIETESKSYSTRDSGLIYLKADMDLIKASGFNTVRLVGIGEMRVKDYLTGELVLPTQDSDGKDIFLPLMDNENQKKYFEALRELFSIVNNAGLKIIFLNKMLPDVKSTETHFSELAYYFRNDTSILAYDLFNEPLYFDKPTRTKQEVYQITNRWKKIMNRKAPNHLYTIGLEGMREIFAWDPNIINADFISYHPYEYEPEQVRNEIYWYGKYTEKPWIIGETSIPADNDSVSYESQKLFAERSIVQTLGCGAIGYSWWQYKDVNWAKFHSSYMGVFNRNGETYSSKAGVFVKGTAKPVTDVFRNFDYNQSKKEITFLPNYYNYSFNRKFCLKGKLVNSKNEPIEGGIILAWNEDWTHSYHTVTKQDGSFNLYSNYAFYHWRISATYHSVVAEDILPDTVRANSDGTTVVNLGTIQIRKEF